MAARARVRSHHRRLLDGVAVLTLVTLVWSVTGCAGEGRARLRARDDLVDQLVEGGLERAVARCAVDGFFEPRSNDELEAFFDRPELTAAERDEFARLGERCLDPSSD